jgi:hypothetical protein
MMDRGDRTSDRGTPAAAIRVAVALPGVMAHHDRRIVRPASDHL